VFVIIWGIRSSAVIINPILLALVITITVLPLPGKLTQRGLPGWLALAITMGLVIGGLAVILAVAADADHPRHPGRVPQHPVDGRPGALHARR
jgi:predicted PurR-regulated permease PerM